MLSFSLSLYMTYALSLARALSLFLALYIYWLTEAESSDDTEQKADICAAEEGEATRKLHQQRLRCQYLYFCTSKASKLISRSACISPNT